MAEETLKLNRFMLDGKPMVDIRWWYETKRGPRPQKQGLVIEQKMVTRLVWALHQIHADHNRDESRRPAGIEG